MRLLVFLLLVPIFSTAQTVHIKEENIVYEGKEKLAGISATGSSRINEALLSLDSSLKILAQSSDSVKVRGVLKLKTPYNSVRLVQYSFMVRTTENGYSYLIDSVSFTEKKRGEKEIVMSAKEALDNMGETGKIVGETEKILNETDMRFQKMLALLRRKLGQG